MQKKSLLVALFCGALCLTGCLKNEDSASVAQVRIAKANELNSIAKLNEAKAAAEAVYAQAELTVANAEAKLREANAALVLAQAETEKVRAELLKVQVALAEVKVDEERVKLLELEAKLEQTLAEVEAAVAMAEAEKQGWINVLNHAIADAERQALVDAKAILMAENDLENYLLTQEGIKADSAKVYSKKYFAALDELQKLQFQQIKIKAQKALVEAGALEVRDAIYAAIDDIDAKIEENEAIIAILKERQTMTPEEAKVAVAEAKLALEDAYTKKVFADSIKKYVGKNLTDLTGKNADFTQGWYTGSNAFKSQFEDLLEGTGLVWYKGDDDVRGVAVFDEDTEELVEFTPLFTSVHNNEKFFKTEVTRERYPDLTVYTGPENNTNDFVVLETTEITPLEIYFDNANKVLDAIAKIEKENSAADVKEYEEVTIPAAIALLNDEIDELKDSLDLHTKYVNARKATIAAKEQAYIDELKANAAKKEAVQKAWNDWQEYVLVNYDGSREVLTNQWTAQKNYDDAVEEFNDVEDDYNDAIDNVDLAKKAIKPAIEAEAKAQGAYYTAKNKTVSEEVTNAWNAVKNTWNPDFVAETAKRIPNSDPVKWANFGETYDESTAVKAASAQNDVLNAQDTLSLKKEEEYVAQVAYWRVPTEANKNTHDNAVLAVTAANTRLTNVKNTAATTENNYNAVKAIYDAAAGTAELETAKENWNPEFNDALAGEKMAGSAYTVTTVGKDTTNANVVDSAVELKNGKWQIKNSNPAKVAGTAQNNLLQAIADFHEAVLDTTKDQAGSTRKAYDDAVTAKNSAKTELDKANKALIAMVKHVPVSQVDLSKDKIEDYLDEDAKDLYDKYTAAVKDAKLVHKAWDELQMWYRYDPDEIDVEDNPAEDNKYHRARRAQYSWKLSSYMVDYKAQMLGKDGEYYYIASTYHHPRQYWKDANDEDVFRCTRSLAYMIEQDEAAIAAMPKDVENYKASAETDLKNKLADIEKVRTNLMSYKPLEADYLAWIKDITAAEKALNEAKKLAFDANEEYKTAKAVYEAVNYIADGFVYVYDPDNKLNVTGGPDLDGFVKLNINDAIEALEGETDGLYEVVKGLYSAADRTINNRGNQQLTDIDLTDITSGVEAVAKVKGLKGINSIAELTFAKELLQNALKYGKVALQYVLEAYDEEIAELDEKLEFWSILAEKYKAIMNIYLGIVENAEGETGPLDGEGEGDDEE